VSLNLAHPVVRLRSYRRQSMNCFLIGSLPASHYGLTIYEFNSQKLQTDKSKKMNNDKNSIHATHTQSHIRPTQYTVY